MLRMKTIQILALASILSVVSPPLRADEATLIAAFKQGVELQNAAKNTEAATYYEYALKLAQNLYGENHKNTAAILNNLGNVYHDLGKYAAAEPLHKRTIAIGKNCSARTISMLHSR